MNNSKTQKAAVLIHGFLGNPRVFDFLLPTLKKHGRTPIVITLPGHGGDLDMFCRHRRADWQRHVDRQLHDVAAQYEDVVIVTHSMGGLLALRSPCLPSNARVFALALPLRIRMTPAAAITNFRVTLPASEQEPRSLRAARGMLGVSGITPLRAFRLLPNTFGLLKLSRTVRKQLKHDLKNPTTVIWSTADGVVSPRSKKELQHLPNADHVLLQKSEHFYYTDPEQSIITKRLQHFLQQT